MGESSKYTLRTARINVGLSAYKASNILHISRVTLSKYERGESSPTWEMLMKMAELYKIDWRDFILPSN